MSTSSTTTPFACRGRSEPESPRSSRNDMRSTNGSPPARCGSSASRIPFTGWSLGSSSRSLAVMCRSSATTTLGRSRDSSRSLLLRLLFFAAGVIGFLLRGLLRFLLLDHRRPDAPRGLKPFAFRNVGDALDLDLHAEEQIRTDRRPSRSGFCGEGFRVHFVHPAKVLEVLQIHGRRGGITGEAGPLSSARRSDCALWIASSSRGPNLPPPVRGASASSRGRLRRSSSRARRTSGPPGGTG